MLHEVRNVLNPIVSAAYLLEANAHDPDKVRELAHRIDGFARAEARVAARMQDLLDREAAALDPAGAPLHHAPSSSSPSSNP
jgi:hypothetical protein